MTLMKRNEGLFPSIPSFFDDFLTKDIFDWGNRGMTQYGYSTPAVNILENDDNFEVTIAAPGMKKDDFHVELDNHVLTISSEREEKREDKDKEGNYTRREFRYASFRRSFTLPENIVEAEKIKANYEDGILKIMIPKKEEAKPKPVKTIKIG